VATRVCVCLSAAACQHYCTEPDVTWGSGRGCLLVVHYWADLQSVHGLRCYGNITRTRNVSEYTLVLTVCIITTVPVYNVRKNHNIWQKWHCLSRSYTNDNIMSLNSIGAEGGNGMKRLIAFSLTSSPHVKPRQHSLVSIEGAAGAVASSLLKVKGLNYTG